MRPPSTRVTLLPAALLLLAAAPARAQEEPEFDDDVLEITAPVLDRFQKALAAEQAERRRADAKLDSLERALEPRFTRYQDCLEDVTQSDRYMSLNDRRNEAYDRGNTELAERLEKQMDAMVNSRCGADPGEELERELERLYAGLDSAATRAGGFRGPQYGVLRERVIAYLRVRSCDPRVTAVAQIREQAWPYLFAAREMEVLHARYAKLAELLKEELEAQELEFCG
ncbi:MAG: hypothetical protein HY561_02020 [Gemmatimonadetes bacterium]|nr:hypothetical protein [Gemmatimonadota bacterium]